jgi:hypothetical protein
MIVTINFSHKSNGTKHAISLFIGAKILLPDRQILIGHAPIISRMRASAGDENGKRK